MANLAPGGSRANSMLEGERSCSTLHSYESMLKGAVHFTCRLEPRSIYSIRATTLASDQQAGDITGFWLGISPFFALNTLAEPYWL